ncbi:anti-sigma factor domain-containing protein [Streptomyces sp. NPDC086787]|uniref:anti-sigma factor domain-containing protein n=1 Tax=Streptomyces sp. NPDC086787 TaxID=3365759 RepID=UPI00382A6B7D
MKEAVHIGGTPSSKPDLQRLVHEVALGDQEAFAAVYDAVANSVLGVVRAVLRDQAQSEEVAQDVLVEVWRTAPRYRPERGTAINWILTLAHRRAVDRVRSVEAAAARDTKAAPAPPRGRVYQLWFADGTRMRPAGLMSPDHAAQTLLMRGRVNGASGVGITVEPAGGSRQPTTTPIGLLTIPS